MERSNVFLSKIYDILGFLNFLHLPQITQSRPILQRNGKKKSKKMFKKGKKSQNIWKPGQKYTQTWKDFEKGLVIACDTLIIVRNKLLEKALIM